MLFVAFFLYHEIHEYVSYHLCTGVCVGSAQARIVALNSHYFLKNGGHCVISIKASCVDSTASPEAVFAQEVRFYVLWLGDRTMTGVPAVSFTCVTTRPPWLSCPVFEIPLAKLLAPPPTAWRTITRFAPDKHGGNLVLC